MENTIFNWIIGIIVTILLGAVGSGFWEIMLKPVLRYISFKSMSLTTFVFKRWRDSIYKSIGSGVNIVNNISICFCVGVFAIMSCFFIINFQYKIKEDEEIKKEYNNMLSRILPDEVHQEYTKDKSKLTFFQDLILNKIMSCDYYVDNTLQILRLVKNDSEKYKKLSGDEKQIIAKQIIKAMKNADLLHNKTMKYFHAYDSIFFFIFPTLFFTFLLFLIIFPFLYIDEANGKFMQCLDISIPYIAPSYRDLILSRFRQITSREDFIALIDELQKIAEKEKLIFPKYKIW